jgi:hypothetical protein
VSGDAGDVQPSCAVLEEGQWVEARAERGVEVEEVDRDDRVSLAGEELPPGWAATARGRIDPGRGEDVPHGGGTNPVPQLGQLALDPPMSPSGVLLGQAQDEFLDC